MLGENRIALFPDSVSERGQKHLRELIDLKKSGIDAAMLYIIQREDIDSFSPAKDIDPEYARLVKEAHNCGVMILAYQCSLSEKEIAINRSVKVII